MSDTELNEFYEVCLELTKECGQVIREAIAKAKVIETKSSNVDFVTETDQEVERRLIGGLKKRFPTHKFIGEESTAAGVKCILTDDPTWIIDPVDGTTNFVHGLPLIAISIALLIKKVTVIGVIYNPMLGRMYTARLGKGAFLDGTPIRVSGQTEMSQALICSEVGTSTDPERIKVVLNNLSKLIGKCHGVRALGSCALNMGAVAAGGADAYFETGIHAWDIAAGDLIVREAGGYVMDPSGGPLDLMSRRMICASSKALAEHLGGLLEQFPMERD